MNSTFVNLSSYCILEVISTPLGEISPPILSSSYYLVENNHVDSLQIYNTDGYSSSTHNSRNLSVLSLGASRVIYNDTSLIPIYSQYDPDITETELSPSLSSNLVMDTLRFHFASGFNFTEVENIIVGAKHKLNDLKQIQLATILLDAETAQTIFSYNNRPLFIANTIYDRYVDIKIPSVQWLDADFVQFGNSSFEWAITNGVGFIKNAPITVFLAEATYEEYNAPNNITYDRYQLVNYYEGTVSQSNIFDALGCIIQEADDGDYIQFFATWNGAFPDSLIDTLNDSGPDQNWIITHQLQVYEQIGSSLVPSGNVTVYQENRFDEAQVYRPIIREAGFAVSLSIDYTMRLINTKNGDQVIKTAALSIINPNKYGKKLAKINLPDGPASMKVYNKLVQKNFELTNLFSPKSTQAKVEPIPPNPEVITVTEIKTETVKVKEYVPIKQLDIRASHQNALYTSGKETDKVIYGQGRMILPIDPTDNFIKFIVYQASPVDHSNQAPLDLNNNSTFNLNFGTTGQFSYSSITDETLVSPSRGEVVFRIPKDQAQLILSSRENQFYLTLVSKIDNSETLFYTGTWVSSMDYAKVLTAKENSEETIKKDKELSQLREKVTELTNVKEETITKEIENISTVAKKQTETASTINASSAIKRTSSQQTSQK